MEAALIIAIALALGAALFAHRDSSRKHPR